MTRTPWIVTGPNVVMDAAYCTRCQERLGFTGAEVEVDIWVAAMRMFLEQHRHCAPPLIETMRDDREPGDV